ncbi:MAG: hypothetical protein GAK30_03139 [Paracidovorax wautersii]|uniref:Nucleoside 2-deoxyribosyltransferase n=1 Tax=Paracidovorax wautersii TaxID=1177982 RepID=A0A7V8JP52_9BURK|nr:MAG: hypothetical protein GAK30_03139 [Paracidovorax wautersii]
MASDTASTFHPRIYLAGPDIFYPDQDARYRRLEALCEAHGLHGVRPADEADPPPGGAGGQLLAEHIYAGNVRRLAQAEAVLANLEPFRNPVEPDSGTVFEVGMAIALGKPVVAYLPQAGQTLAARVTAAFGERDAVGGLRYDAAYGLMIEDLGLPLNLMLGCSVRAFAATPEAAVKQLASLLTEPPRRRG